MAAAVKIEWGQNSIYYFRAGNYCDNSQYFTEMVHLIVISIFPFASQEFRSFF